MISIQKLQAFVTEHEQKLQRKIDAAAAKGDASATHRYRVQYSENEPVRHQNVDAVLGQRFAPKGKAYTWPMRYEITPRG